MAARKQIGIVYIHSKDWVGGNYYIQNLIAAFQSLPTYRRPSVTVFTTEEKYFKELSARTRYNDLTPFYLGRSDLNLLQKALNKLSRKLLKKKLFSLFKTPLDIVFPGAYENIFLQKQNFLYWIPDFQEEHLPHFFSSHELEKRRFQTKEIIQKGKYIVLSSESAKQDFNRFYPNNDMRQWVMPFAVSNYNSILLPKEALRTKYHLPEAYFLCSNQFWQHKNQQVVLDALLILREKMLHNDIHIIFTGKEDDYRNQAYFPSLKTFCTDNRLESQVSFLGFISRDDQLSLMATAMSVIQPSLFEGWSTVVEDAKSMGARIIASDLDVHREQLRQYPNGYLFDRTSPEDLAQVIWMIQKQDEASLPYDYNSDIRRYAEKFIGIVEEINKI